MKLKTYEMVVAVSVATMAVACLCQVWIDINPKTSGTTETTVVVEWHPPNPSTAPRPDHRLKPRRPKDECMDQTIISTPGSGTFTVPLWVTSVDVFMVAGGGAGSAGSVGNGGGGGGSIVRAGVAVTPGAGIAYTVGAGGTGGPGIGPNGGDSTFGALTAGGGTGGQDGTGTNLPGVGGTGDFAGGDGGAGDGITTLISGGGGGGAGTTAGTNGVDGDTTGFGGAGGTGSGDGGDGSTPTLDATNGTSPGGGGGGGEGFSAGTPGSGGDGYLAITYASIPDAVGPASGSYLNPEEDEILMQKNVSGQKVGAQLIDTSALAFTGTVTVYVTGDAGTQAVGSVGSGICTHEGNGYHTYAPSQAETNYDLVAFTFIGTGAVPVTVQRATTMDANVKTIVSAALAQLFSVDSGTTYASAVSGSVVKEIADNAASAGLNLTSINGTSIAGTGTQVADAFVTLFNVASPVLTAASVNQTGDSYAIVNSGTFGNSALKTLIDTVDTVVDGIATSSTTIEGKIDVIDGNVDSILVDTAEIGAAGAGLTALATQASVDVIDGNVDSILVDTAEIGAAGAGLTALSTQASVDAIQADTNDIQTRIPAALVSGRMDSSVGVMATNTLTADALATDAVTEIQSGLATTADVTAAAVVCCKLGFAFTSSAGTEARFIAWLESNGQFVVLPSGTCDIDIREEGSGTDLFTVTAAAPEADGTFYLEKTTPGFTADRVYKATVTIVDDAAATWVSVVDLPVWA